MRSKVNLLFSLVAIAGCSQVLGLGDYSIDPNQDGIGGPNIGDGGTQGEAGGDSMPSAGKESTPAGGEPNLPEGGQPGQGGEPPVGHQGGQGNQGGEDGQGGQGQAGQGGGELVVIPCDSVQCCTDKGGKALGVELLQDGGFELGLVSEGASPWSNVSTNDFDVITNNPDYGFKPKSGSYYAYLSGLQGERSSIYSEDLTIPDDAGWITVSGYRLFQIDAQDNVNDDFCLIAFYDADPEATDPLELPFWWGRTTEHTDGWGDTPIWKKFEASWDATPHRGLKRYLGLRGESDTYPAKPTEPPKPPEEAPTVASSFLFDDVSLKAFKCVE